MAATTPNIRIHLAVWSFAAILIAGNAGAFADAGHGKGDSIGELGTKARASRTITIKLGDNFFDAEKIQVKKGETIRFKLKNTGEFLHEFNIGTAKMHAEHQKEMVAMMEHGMLTATGIIPQMTNMDHSTMGMNGASGMMHDDLNSVLIEPGKTKELVWKFSEQATLEFACNLPGHYESGMVGKIKMRS